MTEAGTYGERRCAHCGEPYVAGRVNQRYCRIDCRQRCYEAKRLRALGVIEARIEAAIGDRFPPRPYPTRVVEAAADPVVAVPSRRRTDGYDIATAAYFATSDE